MLGDKSSIFAHSLKDSEGGSTPAQRASNRDWGGRRTDNVRVRFQSILSSSVVVGISILRLGTNASCRFCVGQLWGGPTAEAVRCSGGLCCWEGDEKAAGYSVALVGVGGISIGGRVGTHLGVGVSVGLPTVGTGVGQ